MARLDELERKFAESPNRYFASLANEYRKAGEPQRAAEMCRTQLASIPGHISGHIVLGQALYDSGDFEESRTALERALTLDPENIVALRYLGDIARDTGDVSGAERWYSRTLEADPYNEAATAGLQLIREQSRLNPPERASASEAEAPAAETIAFGFEPTALTDEPPPPADSFVLDEAAMSERGVVIEPADTTAASETTQPMDDPNLVTDGISESIPESSAESILTPVEEETSPASLAATEQRGETAPDAEADDALAEDAAADHAANDAAVDHWSINNAAVDDAADPAPVPATEATPESEPVAAADAEQAPSEFEQDLVPDTVSGSADFAGDLEISAAGEAADQPGAIPEQPQEAEPETIGPEMAESVPEPVAADTVEHVPADETDQRPPQDEPVFEASTDEEPAVEPVDVAAHPLPEPVTIEELIQTEERVMESAAPFVTETMADLYLEQGYPHEALELLLQLSEQRPDDAQLREKVETIKSVIAARRDAAVAAARAERAEAAEMAETAETAASAESAEIPEPMPAREDTTSAAEFPQEEPAPAPEPSRPLPAPRSVRELFARMDSARPRGTSAGSSRAPSRLRSDFVPLPNPGDAHQSDDDPFGFPDAQRPAPPPPVQQPGIVPRTSGPHTTFDPSTAEPDDFDAWLRGLRGP